VQKCEINQNNRKREKKKGPRGKSRKVKKARRGKLKSKGLKAGSKIVALNGGKGMIEITIRRKISGERTERKSKKKTSLWGLSGREKTKDSQQRGEKKYWSGKKKEGKRVGEKLGEIQGKSHGEKRTDGKSKGGNCKKTK